MSPSQAAYISKLARKAVCAGLLTPHQLTVLEALLWDFRARDSDRVTVSYAGLQKLTGRCRQTIADTIKAATALGLMRKIKHKILTLWANGGRQWQQKPNEYVFHCESAAQTEYPKQVIQILKHESSYAESRLAQAGLDKIRAQRQPGLFRKGF